MIAALRWSFYTRHMHTRSAADDHHALIFSSSCLASNRCTVCNCSYDLFDHDKLVPYIRHMHAIYQFAESADAT